MFWNPTLGPITFITMCIYSAIKRWNEPEISVLSVYCLYFMKFSVVSFYDWMLSGPKRLRWRHSTRGLSS